MTQSATVKRYRWHDDGMWCLDPGEVPPTATWVRSEDFDYINARLLGCQAQLKDAKRDTHSDSNMEVRRYNALVCLSMTPDGVALADPEVRTVVLASDYDALAAQLSACQARVEEAEKDARRLDWMLTNEGSMHISGNAAYGYRVCDVSNGLVFVTGKFPTAREAIDAALGADGGGTKK